MRDRAALLGSEAEANHHFVMMHADYVELVYEDGTIVLARNVAEWNAAPNDVQGMITRHAGNGSITEHWGMEEYVYRGGITKAGTWMDDAAYDTLRTEAGLRSQLF